MEEKDVIIIGAGISGLACAHFLKRQRPELSVLVVEKSDQAGGVIRSHSEQGYLCEWGPHGFLDNKEESREILADLDLIHEVQRAPLSEFQRYLCRQGRLVALPQKPLELLTSKLLTPWAKVRLLGDLCRKPLAGQPTIGEWAAYRFGKGVLPLVDAAVTGTFSGDLDRLSMDAVMPGVRRLEMEHGSLLRGLKKKGRAKKEKSSAFLPAMINFQQGLEKLVQAMAKGHEIKNGCEVHGLAPQGERWQLATNGGPLLARHVICALPVNRALALLAPFRPPVQQVPESFICNVSLGFVDNGAIPKGFGYLTPECEGRFVLGCMFTSRMFPGRAPQGRVLLEALVGGRRHPERLELSDEEMGRRVVADLRQLLPLPEAPEFVRVLRPPSGIPQLEKDHLDLLAWRTELEEQNRGLALCGFGWDGIGINDMTRSARQAVAAMGQERRSDQGPEVKPVYF
ncbi:MAG: protoporphyrinogen oxidase [Desulfurivibrionaceae bacterium]|nr:protoporphyrinogen oxidase [Desulfurivibrionaceae bacterium]